MSSRAILLKQLAELAQEISNLQSSIMAQDAHLPSQDVSGLQCSTTEQDTHSSPPIDPNLLSDIKEQDTVMSEASTTSLPSQAPQPRVRRNPGFLTEKEHRYLSRTGRRAFFDRLFSVGFPGKVTIEFDLETALLIASAEYSSNEMTSQGGRMVFWTDSCTNRGGIGSFGRSGIGIVYRRGLNRWMTMSYHIRRSVPPWVAEMAAIAQALRLAEKEVVMREAQPSTIVIHSDCQKALLRYQDSDLATVPCRGTLLKFGVAAAHNLKRLGIEVELRWAPGYWNTESQLHIKENVLAHAAARKAARSAPPNGIENLVDMSTNPRKKRAPFAMFKVGGDGETESEFDDGIKNLSIE